MIDGNDRGSSKDEWERVGEGGSGVGVGGDRPHF